MARSRLDTDGLQNPSLALTVGSMPSRHKAIAAIEAVSTADATRNAQQRLRETQRVTPTATPVLRPAREYVAVSGDSWWSIASRVSPSPAPHDVLKALHALQLLNPHLTDLTPGTRMHLPDLITNTD
jgi:Tfp pilus assembly protein FimV